jgi:hypothetical protein
MKISISKLIMYIIVGFVLVWILFVYNVSHSNQHLNLYMDRYILVSLIYIIVLNIVINLLNYIKDNYV